MFHSIKYKAFKKQFKKNVSILLILGIVVSSTNWLINLHFCGGNIVSFGLFVNADNCGMEADDNSCESGDTESLSKEPCCSDHTVTVNSNDLLQYQKINPVIFISSSILPLNDQFKATILIVALNSLPELVPKPPWTLFTILAEYQVFIL
ncbi:MAG: HYC_CC_PP family protein [Salibacteraceae bacterium]